MEVWNGRDVKILGRGSWVAGGALGASWTGREIEIFLWNCLKNWKYTEMCLENWNLFVRLPEEIRIFRKFAWTNRNFLDPDPRPRDFKPDWRRWREHHFHQSIKVKSDYLSFWGRFVRGHFVRDILSGHESVDILVNKMCWKALIGYYCYVASFTCKERR